MYLQQKKAALNFTFLLFRSAVRFIRDEFESRTLLPTLIAIGKKRSLTYAGEISFAELLERKAEKNKDRVLLKYMDEVITYRQMNERSNMLARGLKGLGASPGEGLAIMMGNCSEFLYTFFASQKLGMYLVPVNVELKGDGLSYILNHSEVKYLVVDHLSIERIREVRHRLKGIKHIVLFSGEAPVGFKRPRWTKDFYQLMGGITSNLQTSFDHDNICIIMYTSGTTGLPKGVVYRYRYSGVKRLGLGAKLFYNREDVLYTCLPLFHANALFLTFTQALWADAQVAMSKRFSASRFWDEVRKYKATTFNTIGAMIPILLKQPARPEDDKHYVKRIISAACPQDAWEPFERRFGVKIWEGYAAVDGGGAIIFNAGTAPVGSLGKPMGGLKYRIVDDEMRDLKVGEPGELVFWRGEERESRVEYFKNKEASNEKIMDGWLHTGDLVKRDKKGYLYFVGRSTESMRRRGENVSAYEVEKQVEAFPKVLECAAYGVPSEMGEDDIMISVIPVECMEIDVDELLDFLKERLARFAMPRYINILDELPKTSTHRVIKKELIRAGVTNTTIDMEKRSNGQSSRC